MPFQMSTRAVATAGEAPSAAAVSESLLRSTILVAAIQVAGAGLRYGSSLLFARWLGASDYGNYAYAIALAQILSVFGALGLPSGVLRFVPDYRARRDWPRLRGLTRRARQLAAAAAIACAMLVSGVLVIARPANLSFAALVAGVWLTPIMALSALESELSRSLYSVGLSYALPMIVDPLVSIALALAVMRTAGYLTAALAIGARCAALALTLVMQVAGSEAAMPEPARNCEPASETTLWLRVSFHLLLVGAYSIVISRADVLILGLFHPTKDVGVYSAATSTAALGSLFLIAANSRGGPMMSAMFAGGDKSGLERVVHTLTSWAFWPSLAIALVMWAGGGRILALFGPGFSAGYATLAILMIGQVVNSGAGPVLLLAAVTGHQAAAARVFGWSALTNVAICFVLVPRFGLLGAALASSATMALWNIWLHQVMTRNLGIRPVAGVTSLRSLTEFFRRGL